MVNNGHVKADFAQGLISSSSAEDLLFTESKEEVS